MRTIFATIHSALSNLKNGFPPDGFSETLNWDCQQWNYMQPHGQGPFIHLSAPGRQRPFPSTTRRSVAQIRLGYFSLRNARDFRELLSVHGSHSALLSLRARSNSRQCYKNTSLGDIQGPLNITVQNTGNILKANPYTHNPLIKL